LVVCFNKWDAVVKDSKTADRFKQEYARHFAFATYAPLLYVSATEGTRLHRVLETAWMVGEARSRRIGTAALNRVVQEIVHHQPPRFHAGGTGVIKYATQSDVRPPRFVLFVNNPTYFHRSYLRYVNNGLRAAFEFPGSVLRLELRASGGREGGGEDA
jgi:GTP-binding protein